jgi:Fe-S cluster assembly scaffold protein SufB
VEKDVSADGLMRKDLEMLVKDVLQQLPMEFAVEAQKLISISLEGSVG